MNMVAPTNNNARTGFGEPNRKPSQQLLGGGGVAGNKTVAAGNKNVAAGGNAAPQGKKKAGGSLSCCKKKQPGVKKAAPPKNESKRSLGSLFRRNKTTKNPPLGGKKVNARVSKGGKAGIRPIGKSSFIQSEKHLPQTTSSKVAVAAAVEKPKVTTHKNGQRQVKKASSNGEIISLKSPAQTSLKSDVALKTAMDDSVKSMRKFKVHNGKQSTTKSIAKERAFKSCRNFQEVKISTAAFDNGMTERKVVLTSLYPTNGPPKAMAATNHPPKTMAATNHPPKAIMAANSCDPRKNKSYTSLTRANSTERFPTMISLSEKELLASPEKNRAPSSTTKLHRDRALSTIFQLRGHYQLTHDEIRLFAKNPDLKVITIRACIALQEAQRNLRNLKVLAGSHLLPDLPLFSDELSTVIIELDRFIEAIQTVSEHAEGSPKKKKTHH